MQPTIRRAMLTGALLAVLAGCSAPPAAREPDVVLHGERHDDPAHHRAHLALVQDLAARGRLAGLALEMADQGGSTAGLPREAGEDAVRAALRWDERAWPWAAYGPAVMAAVRAGVPVLGANLPRAGLRPAMADAGLDVRLDPQAWQAQREAIRAGHCDLLPAGQLQPMARVQVARDMAMAATLASLAQPGRTVVLLAGSGHVDPQLGVPRHLPPALGVRPVLLPGSGQAPSRDYCAELRRQMQPARP